MLQKLPVMLMKLLKLPSWKQEWWYVTDYDIAHFLLDVCNFVWPGKEPDSKYEEPRTLQEVWHHPDPI